MARRAKDLFEFWKKAAKAVASFFKTYSDDILKILGAGAFVGLVVKLIKDYSSKNEQARKELAPLLEKLEKEKKDDLNLTLDDDTMAELNRVCEKYPEFERMLRRLVDEKMDKIVEAKHEESEDMETALEVMFPFSKEYMKADDAETQRAKNELVVGLLGQVNEDGVFEWLDPDGIAHEKTRNALITVQKFMNNYVDSDIAIGADENGNPIEDDMSEAGIMIYNSGVLFTFSDPDTSVTDELKSMLEELRKALGILIAEEPDEKNVEDKYFREYFLD